MAGSGQTVASVIQTTWVVCLFCWWLPMLGRLLWVVLRRPKDVHSPCNARQMAANVAIGACSKRGFSSSLNLCSDITILSIYNFYPTLEFPEKVSSPQPCQGEG